MAVPNPSEELDALSTAELRRRCGTRLPGQSFHESYCYELFRRAIVQHDQHCWVEIIEQYKNLVYGWLRPFMPTGKLGETTVEEMGVRVFTKFWQFYDPAHLQEARGLASILDYLKSCVRTCILEEERAQQRHTRQLSELSAEAQTVERQVVDEALNNIQHEQIWRLIRDSCKDESEQLIAWLTFQSGLTPREIKALHPEQFRSVDEVHTMKRKLLDRLRRNKELRATWEKM